LSDAINLPVPAPFRHHRAIDSGPEQTNGRRSFFSKEMDGRVKPGHDGKQSEILKAEGDSASEHFSVKTKRGEDAGKTS
jgi:hypothetical protein